MRMLSLLVELRVLNFRGCACSGVLFDFKNSFVELLLALFDLFLTLVFGVHEFFDNLDPVFLNL
jgi:hypothetical protein